MLLLAPLITVTALLRPAAPDSVSISRRAVTKAACAASITTLSPWAASAADSDITTYVNKEYGVSFNIPASWSISEGELSGGRRIVVATDPKDNDFNAFIAFTPIAGDYTSLGSFGNLESVGATLLPACSGALCTLAADNVEGKMLDQSSVKGAYTFDYLISATGAPDRHLRSVFSIKTEPARATSTLVTLTAQCLQSRHAADASTLRTVCDSFKYL